MRAVWIAAGLAVALSACQNGAESGQVVQTELQWSGYVSTGRTFEEVSARFVVPAVSCPQPNMNASFWVGLDGYDNTTVEQVGVEALCRDGVARYAAWWPAYPAPSHPLDFVVAPGDEIALRVSARSAGVTFELLDLTSSVAFDQTVVLPDALFTSAEVIAEQSGASQGPLSDFGGVVFDEARIDGEPIGEADPLVLVMGNARGEPRVAVSPLDPAGGAFTVTWLEP